MSEILSLFGDRDAANQRALGALRAGELIVVPTDTVYGLAADAFNQSATRRIFELKNRPRALSLPVLVSRPRQAWALCSLVPPEAAELASAFWPGALTIVLRANDELRWDLGDTPGSVAIRMPAHDDLIALLEQTGPLAVTSANITGEPTPQTVDEVHAKLGEAVSLYLDGGPSPREIGSTIVDLTGAVPAVVREGPIPATEIRRVTARSGSSGGS